VHVDALDAVERAQPIGDRGGHGRHERAPAGREHEVDVDVAARDADVLDDAHVDDADATVGAARVVDLAQRMDEGVAVWGHGIGVTMRNPVVWVAR
jgi:hypothetical protein